MNRAKTPVKAPAKTPVKAPAKPATPGSKAMAGKTSSSGKAGIKAILSAFRGKAKASAAPKSKPKTVAAKSSKASARPTAKVPTAKVEKMLAKSPKAPAPSKQLASRSKKPLPTAKATKGKGAETSTGKNPTKNSGKNGAVAFTAPAKAPAKGKLAGGKNSAAVAAAAVVQKVTARLSGRASLEASTEAVCREVACEGLGTTAGYCRLHYIKNWRKIKRKEVILREGKLNIYIEELVAKYPEKYLEAIRLDLANDKEFAKVIHDLDLDESIDDFEGEAADSDAVIDTIKREFDDDTETF